MFKQGINNGWQVRAINKIDGIPRHLVRQRSSMGNREIRCEIPNKILWKCKKRNDQQCGGCIVSVNF